MITFLLAVAADALGGIVGSAAFGAYNRMKATSAESVKPPPLEPSAAITAPITRALREAGFAQTESIAISRFLATPEGLLLARYIAIDVVAHRADDNLPTHLVNQAKALFQLSPMMRGLDRTDLATVVVTVLQTAVAVQFRILQAADKNVASRLIEIANSERQAYPSLRLEDAYRELWDIRRFNASDISNLLDRYAASIAEQFALLSVPSLYEERRVPFDDLYVEPSAVAGRQLAITKDPGTPLLLRCLGSRPRIVALGDPGGGKSTMLRAAVRHLAAQYLARERTAVPIVVPVARYWREKQVQPSLNMISFLAQNIEADLAITLDVTTIRYLLATGQAVLFVDGLDEILAVGDRGRVRDEIEGLLNRFRSLSTVVTSREIGYLEAPLSQAAFASITLQPFDGQRVEDFSRRFFTVGEKDSNESATEGSLVAARFVQETVHIASVRQNPLMLGLLCILYKSGRTIPESRGELYRTCAEMLFSRWDSRRGIEVLVSDADAAEDAIGSIALDVFLGGEDEVSEDWLRERLRDFYVQEKTKDEGAADAFARAVLDVWRGRKWLLVDIGIRQEARFFKFSHRTFMEYFAAQQSAFLASTPDLLWETLQPYVSTRSASVYSQLVTEIFSRKQYRNGDRFLQVAAEFAANASPAERWNIFVFLSEVLPSLRALAETKAEVCRLVVANISQVALLSRTYRRDLILTDVFSGIRENDEFRRTRLAALSEAEDQYEDISLSFSQATEPLQHLLRAGSTQREFLLDNVAACILHMAKDPDIGTRARAWRLGLELEVFPFLEDWDTLDAERVGSFERLATSVKLQLNALAPMSAPPHGVDFWLDIYLARAGWLRRQQLVDTHGVSALVVGGWGLPLVSAPQSGTEVHKLVQMGFRSLATGAAPEELEQAIQPLEALVMDVIDEDNDAYDRDLFAQAPPLPREDFPPEFIACSNSPARRALFLGCLVIAIHGDYEFFNNLDDHGEGSLQFFVLDYCLDGGRNLSIGEIRELEKAFGFSQPMLQAIDRRIRHLPFADKGPRAKHG